MLPRLDFDYVAALFMLLIAISLSAPKAHGQAPQTLSAEEVQRFKDSVRAAVEQEAKKQYDTYRESSRGSNSDTDGTDNDPVTLEAGQANGKGTITWKPKGDCEVTEPCWSMTFSAPTDKDSEQTDFTNLDGLAKDLTLGFGWRKSLFNNTELEGFISDVDALCDALDLDPCYDVDVASAVKDIGEDHLLRRYERVRSMAAQATSVWFINGKVSVNEYEYFDANDEKANDTEVGMSLKGGYAWVLGDGRASISAAYQRSYKASKTMAQLCEDAGSTGTLQSCETLPLGAPERIDSPLLQFEYRRRFTDWVLSPLVSYDFEQDVTGVEMPLYLIRDEKGSFTGGIKFGWRSDTDKLEGSVFVSRSLGLLGNEKK